ncbi:retrovirus-related pol polyprotein from transposon TNT 1-94 [Tanacetum coccineum]
MTQVNVLMALADDELAVGKNHASNGEWIDITIRKVNILLFMDEDADWQTYLKYINIDLKFVEEKLLNLLSKYNKLFFKLDKCKDDLLVFKQAKLEAITFQLQNAELIKQNHVLHEQLKEDKRITESSSKNDVKENAFIPASMDYDHEMILKFKDWVERHHLDNKLPKFNIGRILVLESQVASLSSEVMPLTYQEHSRRERHGLGTLKHTKPETNNLQVRVFQDISLTLSGSLYMDSGYLRSMNDVKSYLHKYMEKPCPKYLRKSLHLLHMDLFGPVSHMSISHEKYTLVIVDEYSSQTNNGTKFRNQELESFCDEKGISQNFSSPYTPEQNSVPKRKNSTLIEAARTMMNGLVLSKHLWIEAVTIACYT